MDRDYIDLTELQARLREEIEISFPERCWVRAEIASVQAKANGHCYLDLSQSEDGRIVARAKAVVWRSRYAPLRAYFREATGGDLAAGMEVLLRVQVGYSELYGLTLSVDEIEPRFTLGAAELQRRRTLEKLEADGLLDRQKELEPALLPYRLAVISARDAAGYGDFRRHLEENAYGFVFSVELFEATMQGQEAPASIVDALERVECAPEPFDAVLLMRGGGSALDLACFDDYGLCFAIANCPVPVYTAIGHDRDFHVADQVAYDFVKTPTALADRFIEAFAAEDERISSFGNRLRMAFASRLATMEQRLVALGERIHGADPRGVLARGYTLVTDARGVVVKSAQALPPGTTFRLMFADGTVEAVTKG
ncbi:MAG: exodeoxyribonuclease VII large subunit [Bacteroidales bacterium]|nr:exodeoxyribonuclease VII large subunit [Bacteroidales bacterium]